jgi:hypothetical protein
VSLTRRRYASVRLVLEHGKCNATPYGALIMIALVL